MEIIVEVALPIPSVRFPRSKAARQIRSHSVVRFVLPLLSCAPSSVCVTFRRKASTSYPSTGSGGRCNRWLAVGLHLKTLSRRRLLAERVEASKCPHFYNSRAGHVATDSVLEGMRLNGEDLKSVAIQPCRGSTGLQGIVACT